MIKEIFIEQISNIFLCIFFLKKFERECWAILNKPKPKVEPPKEADASKQQPPPPPPPSQENQQHPHQDPIADQPQPTMEVD